MFNNKIFKLILCFLLQCHELQSNEKVCECEEPAGPQCHKDEVNGCRYVESNEHCRKGGGPDWGYETSNGPLPGPLQWCKRPCYKRCCKNVQNQSPINIATHLAKKYRNDINLFNFNVDDYIMELHNIGTTVDLLINGRRPSIAGGLLGSEKYNFVQLHFHWGSKSSKGSEHSLNGKVYPMEMHIVHIKKLYHDLNEARCKENYAVAVLGVFFQMEMLRVYCKLITKIHHEISRMNNRKLDEIVDNLHKVQYRGQICEINSFPIKDLLPNDKQNVYYYNGSLTTPSCFGNVRWIMFEEPVKISEKQINKFRELCTTSQNEDCKNLVDNFRPLQNPGGRNLFGAKYHLR